MTRLLAQPLRPIRALMRLAPIDLAIALAIGLLALCFIAAPVMGADPTASPGAAATPAASAVDTAAPGASASTAPCPLPDPAPTAQPGQTPAPHNLCPAVLKGTDPFSILAWAFTPVFQVIFMALVLFYNLTGRDIGVAIVLVTILMRLLLVPIFRQQIVSQRRMQMIQPELRKISEKYKGNRGKISEEQMKLYKERGYNPASGCLPGLLQMLLLIPMYQVFSQGLSAPNVDSMLQVFGAHVLNIACAQPGNVNVPCINPIIPWLFNTDAHHPETIFAIFGFGVSALAIASALLQLVQTRMTMTKTEDPQTRSQQRIFLIVPLLSLVYGAFLPAGLFIYWITTTVFSIAQQFLILGFGGLFPLFGWTPGFAKDHQPRFPIPPFTPRVDGSAAAAGALPAGHRTASDNAAGTIRPARTRARTSRRGRRR